MVTTLASKGQVTVPKAIRERLEPKAGAKLEFRLQDDGTIQVVPLRSSLKQLK
jgi:AbrB family looped-hinge helix DNA binding protein